MANARRFLLIIVFAVSPLLRAGTPEITSLPASVTGDTLIVHFAFAGILASEDSASVVEGLDLSLVCRLELWQKRKLWFDRLRAEVTNYAEIGYDRWQEKFVLTSFGSDGSQIHALFSSLDSLLHRLEEAAPFRFVLEKADLARESYLAYGVDLKYLTPGKVTDLKEWLLRGQRGGTSGEGKQPSSIAHRLLDLALSSAGFRNRSFLKTSAAFFPSRLTGTIPFPTAVN